MEKITILSIFMLVSNLTFSQNEKIILTKYYKNCSVIFNENYKFNYNLKYFKNRINLDRNDLVLAENIAKDSLDILKSKYFRKNGRQYLGYSNQKNEKIVLLGIFNNYRYPKQFEDFEREFLIGFGDFYENSKNQIILTVNLTTKKLE